MIMLNTNPPKALANESNLDIKPPIISFSLAAGSCVSLSGSAKDGNLAFVLSMKALKSSMNHSVSRRWENSPAWSARLVAKLPIKIDMAVISPIVTARTLKPRFLIFRSKASTLGSRTVVKRNANTSINKTDDMYGQMTYKKPIPSSPTSNL